MWAALVKLNFVLALAQARSGAWAEPSVLPRQRGMHLVPRVKRASC